MIVTKKTSPRKPLEKEIGVSNVYIRTNIVEKTSEYGGEERINYEYTETVYNFAEYAAIVAGGSQGGGSGSIDVSRVENLEKDVKGHTTKITSLENKDKQIDGELTKLKSKDGEIDKEITALKAKDVELEGKINAIKP